MSVNGMNRDEDQLNRRISELIVRLSVYLKPYKVKSILVILIMLFVMVVGILNPYLLGVAIDKYIKNKNVKGLLTIGGLLVGLNILAMVASFIRWNIISSITNKILIDIRHDLYEHLQKLSLHFFDSRPVGKILARVMGDVSSLQNLFNQSIQTVIPELLSLIAVTGIMFFLNVKLALVTVSILPVLAIVIFYIQTRSRENWNVYRKKRSSLLAYIHEGFSGIKVIQAFAMESEKDKTFQESTSSLLDSYVKATRLSNLFWPFVELSSGFGIALVYFAGYKLVGTNEIQIGTLIAFSIYVGMFWGPILNLSNFYNTLISNFSAADRIFDIIDTEPDIENEDHSPAIGLINGMIEFRNVTFGYDVHNSVLKDVSFSINPGDKVALVGATGAGKTTIISLISRFYDPIQGEILVDGKDIKKVSLESYRSQMGIMLQDTFLFSSSIMENIRYGRLDATDEEVIFAAKAVSAHDFIANLKDGYQTCVNERGSRLSLGQRQLISFARALLANPRILILDEATSNIDTHTEILVQKGIEKLLEGRTSFVIAHRLSTIRDCNKIMVIGDGGVKEVGTHDELIKLKGQYNKLYTAQYSFING